MASATSRRIDSAFVDRLPVVDLVRLASVLAVCCYHLALSGVVLSPPGPWTRKVAEALAINGLHGVTLFFVISGFVITRTIRRRARESGRIDLWGFYARRCARILPLLAVYVAVGIIATWVAGPAAKGPVALLHPAGSRFDAPFWVSLATFSFNWLVVVREGVAVVPLYWGLLWSLAVEEQFYLLYPPIMIALGTTRRLGMLLVLVVLCGPLARAFCSLRWPALLDVRMNSFCQFDLIAVGCLLALVLEGRIQVAESVVRRAVEALAGLSGLAIVVATYVYSSQARLLDRVLAPTLFGVGLSAFLFAGIRAGWCSSRPVAAIAGVGRVTYGAYLFHVGVIALLWWGLVGKDVLVAMAVVGGATIATASLLHRYIELPADRRIRAFLLEGGIRRGTSGDAALRAPP